jgi:hypothetical protein
MQFVWSFWRAIRTFGNGLQQPAPATTPDEEIGWTNDVGNPILPLMAEPLGSGGDPAVSDTSEAVDEKVLRLRGEGRAYARISRDLGLARAADAQQAFQRALRRLPATDAQRVRDEEVSRLDRLAARIRADTTRNEMDRARQLKTVDRMRSEVRDDA